jgi:hypothetical protein
MDAVARPLVVEGEAAAAMADRATPPSMLDPRGGGSAERGQRRRPVGRLASGLRESRCLMSVSSSSWCCCSW